jgi:hypothetical protein
MIDFICPNCGQVNLDTECVVCSGQEDDLVVTSGMPNWVMPRE